MEIESLINNLRDTDQYIEAIFMQGGCYRFHLFLKSIYPSAKPYLHLDGDHIVSKINNKYFDIRGKLKPGLSFLYEPLQEEDIEMVKKWSFSKHNALQVNECPVCEEPILV